MSLLKPKPEATQAPAQPIPYGKLLPLPLTSVASLIKGLSYEDMMALAAGLQQYFKDTDVSDIAESLHQWSKAFLNGRDRSSASSTVILDSAPRPKYAPPL